MYSKAIKLALSILLLSNQAFAQQRVEKIDVLEGQKTYKNYVKNPSAIKNTNGTSVSSATIARDTDTADKLDGIASFNCDASALNGYCLWQVNTINEGDKTGNCEVSVTFKGDASLYSLRLTDGTNTLYDLPLKNQTDWGGASFNYPCGATRDVRLVQTTAGTAPAVNIGRIYYGPATNLVNASVVSDTQTWTPTFNSGLSVGTGIDAFSKWTWTRRGEFFHGKGTIGLGTGGTLGSGSFTFTTPFSIDNSKIGTFSTGYARVGKAWAYHASAGRGSSEIYEVVQDALQPNRFKVSGRTDSGSSIDITQTTPVTWGPNDSLDVEFSFPVLGWTSSTMAVIPSLPSSPTIQRFTSGSGTYTTPQGVKYIKVKMVGGGGGGEGTGSGRGGGGNGTATTFGSSLLTANGGGGGNAGGGGGGSVTINSPAISLVAVSGGVGQSRSDEATGANVAAGSGGSSLFGGNGGGGVASGAGSAGQTNTGGGGGGSGSVATPEASGAGGGAGGGIEAVILNPSASYPYTVGAGGSSGAGTNPGGAGGSGVIIVEEYYHTENAPILVGSVTSGTSGAERIERAKVNCSSSSSILSQSGNWVSSITNISSGSCTLTVKPWVSTASCVASYAHNIGLNIATLTTVFSSTTSLVITGTHSATPLYISNSDIDVICMGPK